MISRSPQSTDCSVAKKKEPSWEIYLVILWNLVTVWMDEGRMAGGQFGSLTEIGISTVPLHLVQIFCTNHWDQNVLWSHYTDFVSKTISIKTSKNTFFEVKAELFDNFLLPTKLGLWSDPIRLLRVLVNNWLTCWLADWLLMFRLYECDPALWNCQVVNVLADAGSDIWILVSWWTLSINLLAAESALQMVRASVWFTPQIGNHIFQIFTFTFYNEFFDVWKFWLRLYEKAMGKGRSQVTSSDSGQV